MRNAQLDRPHFPGLNELRAIGALIVIPGHIEQVKAALGVPDAPWFPIKGKVGVVLFFVLSGFLITYLLLHERERTGVQVGRFYMRRVLRIWPLYFLVLLLALLAYPAIPGIARDFSIGSTSLLMLLFLMPNFVSPIPYAGQIWSIGVEEQFYALQPWIVKLSRTRSTLIAVMLAAVLLPELVEAATGSGLWGRRAAWFSCIAIGCLFGLLQFHRLEFRDWLLSRPVQWIAIIGLTALVWLHYGGREYAVDYRLYAVLLGVVVFNTACNPSSLLAVRSRVLDYLGRISYGIYMWHPICVALVVITFLQPLSTVLPPAMLNVVAVPLVLAYTVGVAHISYKRFEKPFLRVKDRSFRPAKVEAATSQREVAGLKLIGKLFSDTAGPDG